MTLTVRNASVTGATTAARALTHAEMDANWAHVIQSANQNYLPSGSGATSTNVQARLRLISITPEDFGALGDNSTNDAAAIQSALNTAAAVGGAKVEVVLSGKSYSTGTTGLTIPVGVTMRGRGRENTFINYTGTGAAITIDGVNQWTLLDFRLTIGTSATAIAINILTTSASVRWGKISNLELAPGGSIVAGQKGIQVVTSGGQIITDNWFEDINLFGIDQPIIRTGTEGNFWRGIDIDTWGATASTTAIKSTAHNEHMQARVAAIPAGGNGVAYSQTTSGDIALLTVDIGAAGSTALNVSGTGNTIILTRSNGTTPVGTIATGNIYLDSSVGLDKTPIGAGTPSTGAFTTLTANAGLAALSISNVANVGVYQTFTRPNKSYIVALDINNNGGTDYTIYDNSRLANALQIAGATGSTSMPGGINSTAIGVTTPSTGAFTTLSATGNILPAANGVPTLGTAATGFKQLYLDYTNTGTVGNVTINKASGRVNLGAGQTTLTLTNSLITAASHIFLNSDSAPGNAVAVQFYAVAGAGSCTINAVPAITNQTAIDFFVVNAD